MERSSEQAATLKFKLNEVETAARWAVNRIRELEARCEKLRMEAEIWAQEARTQKSTVQECYQAVTGATGEPGDWNGAQPVVERIKALEDENARLRDALRLEEEARRTRAQRWTGPEPAIDSDPWAV